jgi:hypothetical protein
MLTEGNQHGTYTELFQKHRSSIKQRLVVKRIISGARIDHACHRKCFRAVGLDRGNTGPAQGIARIGVCSEDLAGLGDNRTEPTKSEIPFLVFEYDPFNIRR